MTKITSKIKRTSIWAQLDQVRCDTNYNIWDQVDSNLFWFSMNRIISTVNTGTIRTRIRSHIMTILRDL